MQLGTIARNAIAEAIETTFQSNPAAGIFNYLFIIAATMPANPGLNNPGGAVAIWRITLPDDWLAAAVAGVKPQNGVWTANAIGAGVPVYWRIVHTSPTPIVVAQGPVSELNLSTGSSAIVLGQSLTLNGSTLTVGNA